MRSPASELTGADLLHDLVGRNLAVAKVGPEEEAQNEIRRRHPPGDGDLEVAKTFRAHGLTRDDHRPISGAHGGSVRKNDVAVLHEGVGVQRDPAHLEPPFERPFVQRLGVLEDVLELECTLIDRAGGEAPEHECILRIGAVAEPNQQGGRG